MLYLLAAEQAATPSNPILPVKSELFWAVLCFTVLYFLVKEVWLPPIQRVRQDRQATLQAYRGAAEAARSKKASASAEMEDQLMAVRAEAQELIDEARAEGEAERQTILARANQEVSDMHEKAQRDIEAEKAEAMEQLRPKVTGLASEAASRVLYKQNLDPAVVGPIVERSISS